MIRIRPGAPQPAAEGFVRHTAHIDSPGGIDDVWFMTPADTRPLADDWLLPVGAVLGMVLGEDVHIAGRVSETLLASMEELQRISLIRHEGLERVRITSEEIAPAPGAERSRVVALFSGGVDAFYTALDPALRIDDLLYVHGFEALVDDERVLLHVLPQIRAAAAELGKPLRLAETNWRSVIEPLSSHAFWVSMPMLFAIAHLMGSSVGRFVVPETHDPLFGLEDSSSVPSYVRLWGTEGLEMLEHGHVPRFEKVRRLTESPVAMRRLRVCWSRKGVVYNCGRCRKCLRTRIHLKLLGVEGRCRTLPPSLRLGEIRRAQREKPAHMNYMDENIAEAEARGMTDLAAALRIQREREKETPTWRHAPRAKLEYELRRSHWSYLKRRWDASLRRLKRRCGHEHLFNCLDAASLKT